MTHERFFWQLRRAPTVYAAVQIGVVRVAYHIEHPDKTSTPGAAFIVVTYEVGVGCESVGAPGSLLSMPSRQMSQTRGMAMQPNLLAAG